MAKTNYTKVEEALEVGLLHMSIQNLLELADKKDLTAIKARQLVMRAIQLDLDYWGKLDKEIYKKLKVKKKAMEEFFTEGEALTTDQWGTIKELKKRLDTYKDEIQQLIPQPSDEELVKIEKKKHRTKRFHVNDKWLPLQ